MNAGRELDVLVAEKVMGWTNIKQDTWHQRGQWTGNHPLSGRGAVLPRFSTDIAAVWEVFGKCDGYTIRYFNKSFEVSLTRFTPEGFGVARADTAPLAICLAALEALRNPESPQKSPQSEDA